MIYSLIKITIAGWYKVDAILNSIHRARSDALFGLLEPCRIKTIQSLDLLKLNFECTLLKFDICNVFVDMPRDHGLDK